MLLLSLCWLSPALLPYGPYNWNKRGLTPTEPPQGAFRYWVRTRRRVDEERPLDKRVRP